MERAVNLKGTQNGYQLILNPKSGVSEIMNQLKTMLAHLSLNSSTKATLSFEVLTGDRLLDDKTLERIKLIFKQYPEFSIGKLSSDVMTKHDAYRFKEWGNVHVIHRIIRNGQHCNLHGDVLFFGNVHEGGKLCTDGNVYLMGDVEGIVQAGYPNLEDRLVIGDLHRAQQVRIGDQFGVTADQQLPASSHTVAYVNDLHALSYGDTKDLKQISPKFYNRIGGIIHG